MEMKRGYAPELSSPLARERCCRCCCNIKQVGSTKKSRPHTCLREATTLQITKFTNLPPDSASVSYLPTNVPTYLPT
jgi:hypothetical protein